MANKAFTPSAPTRPLWMIAAILGIIGIITHYVHVDQVSNYSYILLLSGFILLLIGTCFRKV
jgi:hypothetical protein